MVAGSTKVNSEMAKWQDGIGSFRKEEINKLDGGEITGHTATGN